MVRKVSCLPPALVACNTGGQVEGGLRGRWRERRPLTILAGSVCIYANCPARLGSVVAGQLGRIDEMSTKPLNMVCSADSV
jgi:hypothetical protein